MSKPKLITVGIVEDDAGIRQTLEWLLKSSPEFQCLAACESAEDALRVLPEMGPEVILMDINLPGISGIEALKILRQDETTKHIPIVALSANAMPRDIKKGLEAGFFHYLTKPIKVNEFMDTVDVALEFTRTLIRANRAL